MLIHFGVKPYMVFDGDNLPSKAHTEKDRAARRKESRRIGLQLLKEGDFGLAQHELQKAADVTPLMAREIIEELKAAGIPYVVAPYEADSQLTYLEQQGLIQGVISEDSDLLVFGVRCLLTKLDQYGECVMIRRDDFTACREVSLVGWQLNDFRMMAMLSGCDYLPGIEKLGVKTAYRLVRQHKTIEKVVRTLQFDGKKKVPADYLDSFTKAERTFLYQRVFCPEAKCLVNLTKVPPHLDLDEMPYIGKHVEDGVACGVATGDLDPNTKLPLILPNRQDFSSQRSNVVQTPTQKPGKPISDFFKPRRTPLAELDPNSFTPSPSQHRLLEAQRGASWSASQAHPMRPPPAVNRVASMPAPSSAPQPPRRTVSAQLFSGASPPKRQRLCSDSSMAAAQSGTRTLEGSSSRYFGASPSLRKASKKKDDFELWSDDSVQDAVAALADTPAQSPSPKKRKRLSVFSDAPTSGRKDRESLGSQDLTQDTASSFTSTIPRESQDLDTPATSFESVGDSPSIFTKGLSSRFEGLKSKWAYKPADRNDKAQKPATPPDNHSITEAFSFGNAGKSKTIAPASDSATVPASPLRANDKDDKAKTEDGDQLLSDEQWLALEKDHVDGEPNELEAEIKGSEDFIVPASPYSNSQEEEEKRPSLDLGRFAFAG